MTVDYLNLYENNKWTDFIIKSAHCDTTWAVHRVVMGMASPKIAAALDEGADSYTIKANVITIDNWIWIVYGGDSDVSDSEIGPLFELCVEMETDPVKMFNNADLCDVSGINIIRAVIAYPTLVQCCEIMSQLRKDKCILSMINIRPDELVAFLDTIKNSAYQHNFHNEAVRFLLQRRVDASTREAILCAVVPSLPSTYNGYYHVIDKDLVKTLVSKAHFDPLVNTLLAEATK